jgi:hypothetical protein
MFRPILTAALVFVVTKAALATTIVAAIPSNRIILGADSLATSGEKSQPGLMICKIESEGGVAIATAGLVLIQVMQDDKRFDAAEVSRRAIHGAKDVIDAADRFALFLQASVLPILTIEKVESPQTYRLDLGPRMLTAMVAGFHEGKPVVVFQEFSFDLSKIVENRRLAVRNFMAAGQFLAIDRALKVPGWISTNPIEMVKKSLDLEIAEDPQFVGGPRSIIEIRETDHRWIESGVCDERERESETRNEIGN